MDDGPIMMMDVMLHGTHQHERCWDPGEGRRVAVDEGGSPFAQAPPGTLREQREARRRHLSTDLYHKPET